MKKDSLTQLSFTETMSGYVYVGAENPKRGEKKGKAINNKISFDAQITIDGVDEFIKSAEHEAKLEGTLNYPPFGKDIKIENGKFNLFIMDKDRDTKQMQYRFNFNSQTTGKRYYFKGIKEIERKLWDILDPLDPVKDMTTLFSKIYEGGSDKGELVAAGILRFKLIELPALISSIEVEASTNALKRKAVLDFFSFALGEMGETYMPILFARFMEMDEEYDAVVIGSGFGGSATAYKLAKKGKSVCLLERGKRWSGKVDVKNFFDLVPMFRTKLNNGLFDYKIFKKIHVLQANGVGGGSLIYASVLMRPKANTFDDDWPDEINLETLEDYFKHVEDMLVARKTDYMFEKTAALKKGQELIDQGEWGYANIAVQEFDETKNLGKCDNLETEPSLCRACGNCVLVCNRSAKNTLDFNYIKDAIDYGAELFTEHDVTDIEPIDGGKKGYKVHYKNLKNRRTGTVKAKKVILSGGSLGSTELLLRCKHKGSLPDLSKKLGSNFSGNGDLQSFTVNTKAPTDSTFGPTITSAIHFQDQPPGKQFVVEEGGFPDALAPIANALLPRLDNINNLPVLKQTIKDFIESENKDVFKFVKDVLGEVGHDAKDSIMDTLVSIFKEPVSKTQMYLSIGKDASNGEMKLEDGKFVIDWDPTDSMPLFENMKKILTEISEDLGGSFEENPLWSLFNILVTVHPLGGCKMGKDIQTGVVGQKGEVFGYPNLYVADGSIFPNALGVNPSLTIAAIAERNADIMLQSW